MSVYIPTNWVNNTAPAINEDNLNHLEAGVVTAHDEIDSLVTGTTTGSNAIKVKTAENADRATTVDLATQTTVGGAKIWVDSTNPANIIGHIDAR